MEGAHEVGLFDAHCHPTDMMGESSQIELMKAKALTIMATRAQDQNLVVELAKKYPLNEISELSAKDRNANHIVPSFGWHPWFAHQMYDDRDGSSIPSRREHYKNVLTPIPKDEDDDFLDSLPEPRSFKKFLEETEERLLMFPLALVGEIGLDRSFRVPVAPFGCKQDVVSPQEDKSEGQSGDENNTEYTPGSREGRSLTPFHVKMEHQKVVLKAQLELAGKHQRAVSVHSVATHGIVFDVLQGLWKGHEKLSKSALKKQKRDAENEAHGKGIDSANSDSTESQATATSLPYPPRICLHSYSGPAQSLTQFLNPRVPATMFFSFSQLVNFGAHESDKVVEVIKRMPEEKVLIESDLHRAGDTMDELLEWILMKVCEIKGWELSDGARTCRRNWERFVFGETP